MKTVNNDVNNLLDRIEINPQVMMGKPVIRGTRIPVSVILNLLANGYTFERIKETYPPLNLEDIRAALVFSEQMLDKEIVFKPQTNLDG